MHFNYWIFSPEENENKFGTLKTSALHSSILADFYTDEEKPKGPFLEQMVIKSDEEGAFEGR